MKTKEKNNQIKRQQVLSCPICGNKILSDQNYLPFCSRRCGDDDLSNWLEGKYTIIANNETDI
tara:strand:- start:42 stop:230 length:189 start_codon:yes stop_codon:yes gene_type:complete